MFSEQTIWATRRLITSQLNYFQLTAHPGLTNKISEEARVQTSQYFWGLEKIIEMNRAIPGQHSGAAMGDTRALKEVQLYYGSRDLGSILNLGAACEQFS